MGAQAIRCKGFDLAKPDIAQVTYVRLRVSTPWELHTAHESVPWMAASTWFHYAFFGHIRVRLFDASVPEDNRPVLCTPSGTSYSK